MLHLALRARSVHKDAAYTCTGLGDRIHSCTLAWVYSQSEPVTLHLTADKMIGGQFNNKPESWAEIVALFPEGAITLQVHDCSPSTEHGWIKYLASRGIDAEPYWYGDYPGPLEKPEALDISKPLKNIPRLIATDCNLLQPRSITVQWDSTAPGRTIEESARKRVMDGYRDQGYAPVIVGGEAKDTRLRWSLKHIAYAMSQAEAHVGVDSAFMHLAMLYLPPEQIHLYAQADGYVSHHAKRWRDMGVRLNRHK